MAEYAPTYLIDEVEALWPRINGTYRYDNKEKRSVPCDPFDEGAKYEINFRMSKTKAKDLRKAMIQAYKEKAASEKDWPEKFDNPFTEEDEDTFVFKASLRGAYGKSVTRKPAQFDSKNTKLGDDFLLTTGSTVNIAVSFTPYNASMGNGVSLRLRAIQVLKYAPLEAYSPFDTTDGFEALDGNPFAVVNSSQNILAEENGEIKEPTKVAKKSTPPKTKESKSIDAVVDDWDD
jgi:hypothetical protein